MRLKKQHGDSTKSGAASDDALHHLAFENSSQANIIFTVSTGKIVSANTAACKLLGYSRKELLTKSRSIIFAMSEGSFKKMMKQKADEGQSKVLMTVIKKNGKPVSCEITSAIFMDEEGNENSITTIADMSQSILTQKKIDAKKEKIVAADIVVAQKKSDARIIENNEWIKYIAKASYDVMWDWDITTNEIYVGDSIEEVFGYKVRNNLVSFAEFIGCLPPEGKEGFEKKLFQTLASGSKVWDDSYSFKRHDGSLATTTSRASIVRDESGRAVRMIGAIHDISRMKELENDLDKQTSVQEKDSEKFLLSAILSYDVIWDWKILSDEIFIGEGFEELFGYIVQNNKGNTSDWGEHIHPDDKKGFRKTLDAAIASNAVHWQHVYRFIRVDGSIARVFDRANIFRDDNGKAYRMIGAMQDISREKENKKVGLALVDDKKNILVEKIKTVIEGLINYSIEQLQTNFSAYLSTQLKYDYTYLSNLFTEVEGIPIQKFIIARKIERVKELIVKDELNLAQIAMELHYSSAAHLSNQFKKVTGLTPSHFKQKSHKNP